MRSTIVTNWYHGQPLAYAVAGVAAGLLAAETHRRRLAAALTTARRAALTDPLTGLANRAGIGRHVERIAGRDGAVGLVLIDLDGFKEVNDTYGHSAGDLVLTAIAGRLRMVLLPGEVAARHGGDEFSLVLAGVGDDPAGRTRAARRAVLVASALAGPVWLSPRASVAVTVSAGGAVAADPARAWEAADDAMYQVKPHRRTRRLTVADVA